MSVHKEIKEILKAASDAGWRITGGGNTHYRAYSPDGKTIVGVPCTPGKHNRSIQNTKALFRRAGVRL